MSEFLPDEFPDEFAPAGACVCVRSCEFPCWQRIGITDTPCCAGCAPLASLELMADAMCWSPHHEP